jgi:hypothetical protein
LLIRAVNCHIILQSLNGHEEEGTGKERKKEGKSFFFFFFYLLVFYFVSGALGSSQISISKKKISCVFILGGR